jgi:membrane-associated phospholipid phosphatase
MLGGLKTKMKSTDLRRKLALLGLAFVVFWTPVIVFSKLAGEVIEKEPISLDTTILFWIHDRATPFYDRLSLVITTIGNVEILVPITLLLVAWLLYKKQHMSAFIVFSSVAGASAANIILKMLFHRGRPAFWPSSITETSYSFPSGHAMLSAALVLSIIVITWHTSARWLVVALGSVVVGLIGISRLYLGVHYPSDIIAGWSASLAWVAIVYAVAHGVEYKLKRRFAADSTE